MATKKIVKLKKKVAAKVAAKKTPSKKIVKNLKSKSKGSVKTKSKPLAKAPAKKTTKLKSNVAKATSSSKLKGAKSVSKPVKVKKAVQAKVTKNNSGIKKTVKPLAPAVAKKTRGALDYAQFFQPIDDRVLILRNAPSAVSSSGLILPDTALEKPNQGVVVAVGVGHRSKKGNLRPLHVKLGDEVMFAQYAGTSVELDGQDFLLLREEEILGVVAK